MIHWELCKKLKFDHPTEWYNLKPESSLENETHKILRDFKIQMDPLILPEDQNECLSRKKRRKKKRTFGIVDFTDPADNRVKIKETKKSDKYLDLARELRNMMITVIPIVIGVLGMVLKT